MTDKQVWYLKWWTVIFALITIGPFGFPLLWKSKDFNLFWKWFLTILFIGLTILAVIASWKAVEYALQIAKDYGLI